MQNKPGLMLYFDALPALEILSDEEAGRLFRALLAYGRYGELRELSGPEAVAFQMLRGRIDRDEAAYREKCRKTAYAAYVRESRRSGSFPLEYEAWTVTGDQMMSDDIRRYATITVTPNTTTASNPTGNTKQPPDGFSTEFSTKPEDTDWVLPYLEETRQQRRKQHGA